MHYTVLVANVANIVYLALHLVLSFVWPHPLIEQVKTNIHVLQALTYPGKCPPPPKSRTKVKRPWGLTLDTTIYAKNQDERFDLRLAHKGHIERKSLSFHPISCAS